MTNQQPWQAIVNKSLLTKVPQKGTTLSIVSKEFRVETKRSFVPVIKFATAKRYSFDDNGGGYLGL